jgi:TP901 family phage tail tape measure protein
MAKVMEDDLVASTTLLAGALNAYGESSEMAGLRAAEFYKAITMGHMRAGDLATALGRVQSIAHELGVSVEEVNASLVSLTIGGLKASEAGTQLRGALTALLKPTPEMTKALHTLGVESGPAAIATWGWQEALEKVKNTTDGAAESLAKLFPNVRGGAGAFRLLSEGAQKYKEMMDAQAKIDQKFLATGALEAMSTDAARLTAELNKLRNFFTAEFGATLVHNLNVAVDLLGGGKGLVGALRLVTMELPLAAAAMGALWLALRKVTVEGPAGFNALGGAIGGARTQLLSLRTAFMALAALEVGRLLGQQIGGAIDNWISAPYEAQRKALQDSIELNKQRTDASIREKDRENKTLSQMIRQQLAEASKFYIQDAANFKNAMELHVKAMKSSFEHILSEYRKLTNDLAAESEKLAKKASEGPQKIAEISAGIKTREFNASVDRWSANPTQQYYMYAERTRQLADQAAKLQAKAISDEEQRAADFAWQQVAASQQQALSSAKESQNRVLITQSLELANSIDNERISAVKQQTSLESRASEDLKTRNQNAEAHLDRLQQEWDAILQKVSEWKRTDAEGKEIVEKPEVAAKKLAELQTMVDKFVRDVNKHGKADFLAPLLGDPKALESLGRKAVDMLGDVRLKNIQLEPQAMAKLWADLQVSADKVRLNVKVIAQIEKFTGLNIEQVGTEGVMNAYDEATKKNAADVQRQTQYLTDATLARNNFNRSLQEATAILSKQAQQRISLEGGESIKSPYAIQAEQALTTLDKLKTLSKQANITKEDIARVMPDVLKTLNVGGPAQNAVNNTIDALTQVKDAVRGLNEVKLDKNVEQINAINVQLEKMKQQKQEAEGTKSAIQDQTSAVNSGIPSVASLEQAWWGVEAAASAAAQAAASASLASAGGGGADWSEGDLMAARGGIVNYLGRGGRPRGTDTIPAMLSPGEFVMNSRSTRRFFSQLVAMNAGITPTYRSQGGNVTVGDIHVNGAAQPRETAREVIKSLKRELRRGTSSL